MTLTGAIRAEVRKRAAGCCEYCRLRSGEPFSPFHVDHVIAQKHKGSDDLDNLCLACFKCNLYKGPNIAAIDPVTDAPVRLFHPRRQVWDDHFELLPDCNIRGRTPEGRVTVQVLRLNDDNRVALRRVQQERGVYPCIPDTTDQ